ncbi:MAG: arsinothricin resistance N-acetyltransferase ArsN1 family B [Pseudomonadota bacterium]
MSATWPKTWHRPVKIRTADRRDGTAIAQIYAPMVRQTFISFEDEPPSADDMTSRIQSTLAMFPWLVAEEAGQVVGYAYAGSHRTRPAYRWSCDVSIYLAPEVKRQGVGRRLYRALFDILKRQGFAMAFAGVALPNKPSVCFHEALGFELVGVYPRVGFKNGEWRDVGWWQKQLLDLGADPQEPIPFPTLST